MGSRSVPGCLQGARLNLPPQENLRAFPGAISKPAPQEKHAATVFFPLRDLDGCTIEETSPAHGASLNPLPQKNHAAGCREMVKRLFSACSSLSLCFGNFQDDPGSPAPSLFLFFQTSQEETP